MTIVISPVKADIRTENRQDGDFKEKKYGKRLSKRKIVEPYVVLHNVKWNFMHINQAERDGEGYRCKSCKKWVSNLARYREHYSKLHHTKIGYRCVCKKFFTEEHSYRSHVLKFKDTHKKCFLCEAVFLSDIVLQEHIREEHSCSFMAVEREEDRFGNFSCEKCGVELQHVNLLKQHEERFPNCNEFTKSDEDLQNELNEKEISFTNERGEREVVTYRKLLASQNRAPFTCSVCKMTFQKKFSYRRHLLSHIPEGTRVCPVCGQMMKGKEGLFKHMKTHLAKPYKCSNCSWCSATETELKAHLEQGCQLQFKCDLCDFSTTIK